LESSGFKPTVQPLKDFEDDYGLKIDGIDDEEESEDESDEGSEDDDEDEEDD
jgi:hypothetical protein